MKTITSFISLAILMIAMSAGNSYAQVEVKGAGNTGATKSFVVKNSDSDTSLVILDDGNVGIGTTNPAEVLDINGNLQIGGLLGQGIKFSGYNYSNFIKTTFDGTNFEDVIQFYTPGNQNPNELMRLRSDGRLGIGTTNPGYKLHVNGNFFSSTVNTGLGNYELFAMNQNVRTTDGVIFSTVNTGQGNNELYDMNQNVTTTSNPTFNRVCVSDYGYAMGGMHVGGTSDPGTDNLVVDGTATLTGGLITGENASGSTIKFGKKYSAASDVNPIVTCNSGYFRWDYSTKQVKFTETNAGNNYARFSGMKNEGSGPVLFDGIASAGSTSVVATINSNLEYVSVEVTSELSTGGYIHLYCMFSNNVFVAHYWFRYH